jgi:hypothetical protein
MGGAFLRMSDSQLAVFPGRSQVGVMMRTDWLLAMIPSFLDKQKLIHQKTGSAVKHSSSASARENIPSNRRARQKSASPAAVTRALPFPIVLKRTIA